MTSQVLHNHVEATYITVDSASFYGVKQQPSKVQVNSRDAPFTYRENQVSFGEVMDFSFTNICLLKCVCGSGNID